MLSIAIIGYGKMGKMIEQLAANFSTEIVAIIDPAYDKYNMDINEANLKNAHVCIDFTHPDSVVKNIKKISACKRNLVIGTTGWYEHLSEVEQIVKDTNIGLVYGANMSIGMNLFYQIVEKAAQLFNEYKEYDVYGIEMHHNQKADSPSGTAKELMNILLKNITHKTTPQYEKIDRKLKTEELHFASVRSGFIPGTHSIGFDSEADTIELTHRIRNRTGLAIGALKAALWIANKQGLFTFRDFVNSKQC